MVHGDGQRTCYYYKPLLFAPKCRLTVSRVVAQGSITQTERRWRTTWWLLNKLGVRASGAGDCRSRGGSGCGAHLARTRLFRLNIVAPTPSIPSPGLNSTYSNSNPRKDTQVLCLSATSESRLRTTFAAAAAELQATNDRRLPTASLHVLAGHTHTRPTPAERKSRTRRLVTPRRRKFQWYMLFYITLDDICGKDFSSSLKFMHPSWGVES
ncbi:hypothetical protein B0H17DRAFT_1123646 [Mycena rosella]|uniref:Uncharacterized protein n=1 Tax=Mycena rosella TaxID=1033263 RepID=A0AAD7H2M8_MYCRO|nr:hypothetical protein B0H17DRAFT_1123646 [Mycena rosella]